MPIPFTCPHCGLQSAVPDEYAGQTGPCRQCGNSITVPSSPYADVQTPAASRARTSVVAYVVLGLVGMLIVGLVFFVLLVPAWQAARNGAPRMQCQNNLRNIAFALHNYHDVYGTFPPAYIPDEEGRPMHSWRVLILPFLEQSAIYEWYDFDEPWDGPNNRLLADTVLSVYRCPHHPGPTGPYTHYVMIVGEETISDGPTARRLDEIRDGLSNTLAVVETADAGIHWMEPRDLLFDELTFSVNDGSPLGISSHHPGWANVAFCDGRVLMLDNSVDPQVVRAMATIAGGETLNLP